MDQQEILVAGEITIHSKAFENLTILCDQFGSRFFTTPEEKAAAEFLAEKFREYGLQNVKVEPYTVAGWRDGKLTELWSWQRKSATMKLLNPISQSVPCISLANAPSTSKEGVTAEIFHLQKGTRAYLLEHQEELKGKLVLYGNFIPPAPPGAYIPRDPNNLHRSIVYGYLEEFGTAGLIFTNRNYGGGLVTGTTGWGRIGEIPACGIARESYEFILRQLAKGPVIANLVITNIYAPGATSYNVSAELPGTEHPEEVVLVGGHYDGHDIAPGAMDDAAGACVVLEAARALKKHAGSLKRTIRFCCFAAEELGLVGATGYVLNHSEEELKRIKMMINTDAVGISAKTGHGFSVCGPDQLVPYLETLIDSLGTFDREWELPKVTQAISFSSDHWPFYMRGIPAAHFRDVPADPIDLWYSHTTADTVDKVSPKGLKDAALILSLVLMRLADAEEFPIRHTPIEKINKTLEENGVAENLRIARSWRREGPS